MPLHYHDFNVDDTAPTHLQFNEAVGSNADPSCQTSEECFSLFFSEEVWQLLVDNTNEYATKKMSNMQVSNTLIF